METTLYGRTARQARPIQTARDYDRARLRLAEARKQPGWSREDDRIDALTLAVTEFETRYVSREVQLTVEWAECVFIPQFLTEASPRRRWNDPR